MVPKECSTVSRRWRNWGLGGPSPHALQEAALSRITTFLITVGLTHRAD